LSGTARITQGVNVYVGPITGTAGSTVNVTINFGTIGTVAVKLNMAGGAAVGTYTFTSGTDPITGNIAIAMQSGVTTPDISGVYTGDVIVSIPGSAPETSYIVATQTGNTVYFTVITGGYTVSGTGTIIGNVFTFQITQPNSVLNGSATLTGNVLSGITVTTSGATAPTVISAFSAAFAL
jgi:hypothetical protein